MITFIRIASILLCLSGSNNLLGFDAKNNQYRRELRPIMQSMAGTMTKLVPFYLDEEAFAAPKNRKLVAGYLDELYQHSRQIKGKTTPFKTDVEFYGDSILDEARGARMHFQRGAFKQAHFYVEEVLETCVSCHTSRGAQDQPSVIDFSKVQLQASMNPFAKPKLLAISRQFEGALAEYERLILNQPLSLADILYQDPFQQYLNLAIRVKNDKKRAHRLLKKSMKGSLPQGIKDNLRTWAQSIEQIQKQEKATQNPRALARSYVEKGQKMREYPRDQSGLVFFLEASRILKKAWEREKNKEQKALIAYQLGLSELAIGRSLLGLEAQSYLELAIRLQPKTEIARRSYGLYEENLVFAYSGSAGTNLPKDERERLDRLHQIAYGRSP